MNITMPEFASGLKDLYLNLSYYGLIESIIESGAITYGGDTEYPQFTNLDDNNGSLEGSGIGQFNVSIKSTNGTVGINFDGTNYTGFNATSNIFNASFSIGSVGDYTYYWWGYGNGTDNNYNVSERQEYTIAKATPTGSISGEGTYEYPYSSTIEGTETNNGDYDLSYKLYRDGIEVTNPETNQFSAGAYEYIYNTTGGQNYSSTASLDTQTLTINQNSSLSLAMTKTSPIEYPATTDFVGTGCPSELSCALNISNQVYGAGVVNANYSTAGNENYTASSVVDSITININSSLSLALINSLISGCHTSHKPRDAARR